jgi:hypothetical protein
LKISDSVLFEEDIASMTFAEYIYIDQARLDSYFEQISSPVAYDKMPTWKVGLSLTGPHAEGTQAPHPRPYTQHEKICAILDRLYAERQCRPPELNSYTNFVFESLDAYPVYLPAPKNTSLNRDAVTLWVALPKNSAGGYRFLLEDFTRSDSEQPCLSSFSCLQVMLEEFSESMQEIVITNIEQQHTEDLVLKVSSDLFNHLPLSPKMQALIIAALERAGIQNAEMVFILDVQRKPEIQRLFVAIGDKRYDLTLTRSQLTIRRNALDELSAMITTEPLSLLSRWGAKIGAQRPIDALYRIRQASKDYSVLPKHRSITVIGYPIFLASFPSPFTEKYSAKAI